MLNTNSKFSKTKNETKKDTLKNSRTYIRRPQNKKFRKETPLKVGILMLNTNLKFSKTKNETKKRHPKVLKNQEPI